MSLQVVVVVLCNAALLTQAKSNSKRFLASSFTVVPREIRSCDPPVGLTVSEARVKIFGKAEVRAFATITPEPGTRPINASAFTIDTERCTGEVRTSNNCEHFARWKFPGLCGLLGTKGQFWTPFVEAFTPALRCPVGGMLYKVENATFDVSKFVMPIGMHAVTGHLWTGRVGVQDARGAEILCFEFEHSYRMT